MKLGSQNFRDWGTLQRTIEERIRIHIASQGIPGEA